MSDEKRKRAVKNRHTSFRHGLPISEICSGCMAIALPDSAPGESRGVVTGKILSMVLDMFQYNQPGITAQEIDNLLSYFVKRGIVHGNDKGLWLNDPDGFFRRYLSESIQTKLRKGDDTQFLSLAYQLQVPWTAFVGWSSSVFEPNRVFTVLDMYGEASFYRSSSGCLVCVPGYAAPSDSFVVVTDVNFLLKEWLESVTFTNDKMGDVLLDRYEKAKDSGTVRVLAMDIRFGTYGVKTGGMWWKYYSDHLKEHVFAIEEWFKGNEHSG